MFGKARKLPRWLYELLPYLYLFFGLAVPLTLQNFSAMLSGGLLVLVSGIILWMRVTYRQARRDGFLTLQGTPSSAPQLIWKKSFECGNSHIDRQHQRLFKVANLLLEQAYDRQKRKSLAPLVDQLIAEIESHFSSEEALLEAWNHPITQEHRIAHRKLLGKAKSLRAKAQHDALSYRSILDFLVYDLVYGHIDLEDRDYFFQV